MPLLILATSVHIELSESDRMIDENKIMTVLENGYTIETLSDGRYLCTNETIKIGASVGYEGNLCVKCNWLVIQANKHDPKFQQEYFGVGDSSGWKSSQEFFFRERVLTLYNEVCQ